MTYKILSHHQLYYDERFYSSFPSVVTLKDGRVLLVFRRARDVRSLLPEKFVDEQHELTMHVEHIDSRSHLVQMIFDRDLQLLEGPTTLPEDPEAADQDASLLLMRNGDLLLGSFTWYPIPAIFSEVVKGGYGTTERTGCSYRFWGGNTRLSRDSGNSWQEPKYIPAAPKFPIDCGGARSLRGGPIRGQAVELEDELLMPVYHLGCHLYRSTDGGESWNYLSLAVENRVDGLRMCEPSLYQCASGKLVMFIRSDGGDDHLVMVESTDQGKSWGEWRETSVVGHPYHPLKLPDGRLFLVYGYRHPPYGIRARIVDAECNNIDSAEEIVLRDDGECGDLGYPWSTLLDSEHILIVYYYTSGADGIRHIAATTVTI